MAIPFSLTHIPLGLGFRGHVKTARGRYANVAIIAHTKDEFILDFALAYPGQSPSVGSRVITSPHHAKALLRSLEDNVRKYEDRFGVIGEPPRPASEDN